MSDEEKGVCEKVFKRIYDFIKKKKYTDCYICHKNESFIFDNIVFSLEYTNLKKNYYKLYLGVSEKALKKYKEDIYRTYVEDWEKQYEFDHQQSKKFTKIFENFITLYREEKEDKELKFVDKLLGIDKKRN